MPKPGNQLEKHPLLKVAGTVVAAVGAIVAANAVVGGVKERIEDFQREMEASVAPSRMITELPTPSHPK